MAGTASVMLERKADPGRSPLCDEGVSGDGVQQGQRTGRRGPRASWGLEPS